MQNFRNYKEVVFNFGSKINLIVGPNAAGKTNSLEAIFLQSTGKSFRAEKDDQMIKMGEDLCRVRGVVQASSNNAVKDDLEVVIFKGEKMLQKKFNVNGVPRRRSDFMGKFTTVLFLPTDLEIVIGQPSMRRRFLDDVLEQVDINYSSALTTYGKALRQRNALLESVRETGFRDQKSFAYWDTVLITQGRFISEKRKRFIEFINKRSKHLFNFEVVYDNSEISEERLMQYKQAEAAAGATLVGPHRDDFLIYLKNSLKISEDVNNILKTSVKHFASRGQQRLVVLELKLSQIAYIERQTGERPVLLLDDIFSELDDFYSEKVLEIVHLQQSIITTTETGFLRRIQEELPHNSINDEIHVIKLNIN